MVKQVIRDVEIYYAKLVRPDSYKGGPEKWTLQMRTTDKKQAKEWEDLGFTVKRIVADKEAGEDFPSFWRANVNRKVEKADGSQREPVRVIDLAGNVIDPNTIGNGSRGNLRVDFWEYNEMSGRILDGVQLTEYVVYQPKGEDFEVDPEAETKVDTSLLGDPEAEVETDDVY